MHVVMHLEEIGSHLAMQQYLGRSQRYPAPSDAFGNACGGEGLASSDAEVAWKVTVITWRPVMHLVMHLEEKALHLVMRNYLGSSQR